MLNRRSVTLPAPRSFTVALSGSCIGHELAWITVPSDGVVERFWLSLDAPVEKAILLAGNEVTELGDFPAGVTVIKQPFSLTADKLYSVRAQSEVTGKFQVIVRCQR